MLIQQQPAEILRIKGVIRHTGLSRSSIYDLVKKKQFPAPVKLGVRASGWLQTEVFAWLNNKAAQRRGEAE